MNIFSSHSFSSPGQPGPQDSAAPAAGEASGDIHTMPGKFMAQEKRVSWFRRRIVLGSALVVAGGGGMGLAACLFAPSPPSPPSPPLPPASVTPAPAVTPPVQPSLPDETPPAEAPTFIPPVSPPTSTTPDAPPPVSAPIVPPETPPVAEPDAFPPLPSSRDSDGDAVTDVEEGLWGTDPLQPDSDTDGYLDGQELVSLFDPARANGARLDQAAGARTYVNPQLRYALLAPASWENRLIDPTNSLQTLFAASTGEFISIIARQNVEGFASARAWYASEYRAVSPDALQDFTNAALAGVMSADGLAAYVIDGGYLYAISYNPGLRESVNFKTTFRMMVQSFRTFVTP